MIVMAQRTKVSRDLWQFVWPNVHAGDECEFVDLSDFSRITAQAFGNFSGGLLINGFEGSGYQNGLHAFAFGSQLGHAGSNALAFNVVLVSFRPIIAAGDLDSDVTVSVLAKV